MIIEDVMSQVSRLYPQQLALKSVHSGEEWTYQQLIQSYKQLSVALSNAGLVKGDRAVIVSENTPGHIIFILACARIGVVATPINSLLSTAQMVEVINDSEAPILFYSDTFSGILQHESELKNTKQFIKIDKDDRGFFDSFISLHVSAVADIERKEHAVVEEDILYQMYTSGTTGKSKGAMISHRNVLAELTGLSYALHVAPKDKVLIATPYFHGAAVMMSILALAHGGSCLIADTMTSSELIGHLYHEQVAYCFVVPGMIINMVKEPTIKQADFSALKALIYGAAPIPQYIQYEAIRYFGQKLVQIYGQTETVMAMTLLYAKEHEPLMTHKHSRRIQSVGRQIFGCEVRVFDENDNDVAPGDVGEVVARGKNIMPGYHHLPEATANTLRDGWLRTGDLATVDEDGYIYLRGRMKDLIICDGENVYPIQVEAVIDKIPGVVESAVIGVPHSVDGEQVKAVVVIEPGATVSEDDIVRHCKANMGAFQCPTSVDIVSSFPRNTGGKILKSELRQLYWQENLSTIEA